MPYYGHLLRAQLEKPAFEERLHLAAVAAKLLIGGLSPNEDVIGYIHYVSPKLFEMYEMALLAGDRFAVTQGPPIDLLFRSTRVVHTKLLTGLSAVYIKEFE